MIFLVHSADSADSIAANIGGLDYSYYFVLKKYEKVLKTFGTVIEIRHPETEVDALYENCRRRGEPCLFLSFTPPFKTATTVQCPTLCVFAWEYLTVPTEAWGGNPLHDWRVILGKHGCAVTHSRFAVRAVRQAMGEAYPVWSIPAPLWDDYVRFSRKKGISAFSRGFELTFEGVVIDFPGCKTPGALQGAPEPFIEKRSTGPGDSVSVRLDGVIYTSVFNPNDGRKNWLDMLWAFCWAFRDKPDATLVMKLAYFDFDAMREIIVREIEKLSPFQCRVVALHGFLNEASYTQLLTETTYAVNTAQGEGQCLPLMEYMSAGKPAVAPAHTAMEDYIHPSNAFIVGSSLEVYHWPHDPRQALRTYRYRINWESLLRAYEESYSVAKTDPDCYARMSRAAVKSLKTYCSRATAEKGLRDVLQRFNMFDEGWIKAWTRKLWRKRAGLRRRLVAKRTQWYHKSRALLGRVAHRRSDDHR